MSAATRVIAAQGLGAATAAIAKEAGVSNGSLFTYFDTKADLLNQLYLELKADMGAAALGGLPADGDVREQMLHMWSGWLRWATAYPEKRRALAQLEVSDEITSPTHQAARQTLTGIAGLLERSRATGRCAMRRWRSSSAWPMPSPRPRSTSSSVTRTTRTRTAGPASTPSGE